MGLGSGLFYSLMTLTAKPLIKKVSSYYIVFWQYAIISIMFIFLCTVDSANTLIQNWWKLLVIGIFCTGIAYILFMKGVKEVKAQKILIVAMLEPLAATFFALIILKEVPSLITILGALLIIFGVYMTTNYKISNGEN